MKTGLIVLVLFLVGCTVTSPPIAEYTLSPEIRLQKHTSKLCKEKSLKVGQAFSSNSLMSKKMSYMQAEYEESVFTQSEWVRTPNKAISDILLKSIRDSGLFKNVSSYKSRVKADLLLEAHIEKFIQYFKDDNKKSYVEVVMTLNLLNAKDSKSIAHSTFSVKVDTKSVDAKGGVIALNTALSKILLETNNWLAGVCR
ncbi:MAG: ABC-type transport auxiliary lipoprotein family protein [Sulfurimonas sp.]|nr:ABC-type transport auxiliary lipoprotein family protein [Sulfurimonas sp.]